MESNEDKPLVQEFCASCGAKLKGKYCRKCGEKKIVPERDFSLAKFFTQTFGHIIHFDSRFLGSFWLLFSKPGFLTTAWIAGRRVGYMKPWQLFVVAGLLFYFFLPNVTAYYASSRDLAVGYREHDYLQNLFQYDVASALAQKAADQQISVETLTLNLKTNASRQSKTWLFLIIPFWGGLVYLFFRNKIPWLVPHLVFAMHGTTFFILLDLCFHALMAILGLKQIGQFILPVLMLLFAGYLTLATRRVYGSSIPESLWKTVAIVAGFGGLLVVYRQAVTVITLMGL